MKRTGSKRKPHGREQHGREAPLRPASARARRPNFWDELYWFTIICLGGWILALVVLPPAMVRLRQALEFENQCRARVEALSAKNVALGQVVNAFETDSNYREEVMRAVLGVKKQDEVFLK